MKDLYRKTFDRIEMQPAHADELRQLLASRCKEKETIMKKENKRFRRPVVVIAAVVLVLAVSLTGFAFGEEIVRIYHLISGGIVEQAENYTSISMDTEAAFSPVEERDGRLYLTVNGENKEITDLCSYTEPYIYTCIGEEGLQHIFIIGGDPGAIGWAEFIQDDEGTYMGGMSHFGTNGGLEDAPWLEKAAEQIGLPW